RHREQRPIERRDRGKVTAQWLRLGPVPQGSLGLPRQFRPSSKLRPQLAQFRRLPVRRIAHSRLSPPVAQNPVNLIGGDHARSAKPDGPDFSILCSPMDSSVTLTSDSSEIPERAELFLLLWPFAVSHCSSTSVADLT